MIEEKGDELAQPRPEHRRVEELSRKQAVIQEEYLNMIAWANLDDCWKNVIAFAALMMLVSGYLFFFFGSAYCFRSFTVSSRIDDDFEKGGLNGDWTNIVQKPVGWIALLMFALGLFSHILFIKAMGRHAAREAKLKQQAAAARTDQTDMDHTASRVEMMGMDSKK